MAKLLIVDDDIHIRKLVLTYTELEGLQCAEAGSGKEALEKIRADNFDLVILDIMMPGIDGFETLGEIRRYSRIPVIMLTSRGEEGDKLLGFNLGVDDYVVKPFSPRELMARVNAVLKRSRAGADEEIRAGELRISPGARTVHAGERALNLTPKEFDLLLILAQNERLVLTREQLLEKVWEYNYFGDTRTVDTHIKSLREQLGPYRNLIQTVWGWNTNLNIMKKPEKPAFRSGMVLRLWAFMMALVLLSVVFMWVAQIFLLERNYVNATIAEVQNRLEPVMEDLRTEDLAVNDKLLPYLSKSSSGKIMLVNAGASSLPCTPTGIP
ncbi:response regulator transcription factor [Brucepastera parasyntrophica]|uniref:response regulator transcription factor n=1 Tax=Brucepastera parasyntrophica TaxID=2880008 RepID=UPI00210CBE40|nr:response regulator transcription factor [Brucepastera parasyntrophica]ULQ60441.1 response regulator transcription factor [Brucepastera parasyntrophica]